MVSDSTRKEKERITKDVRAQTQSGMTLDFDDKVRSHFYFRQTVAASPIKKDSCTLP